MTGEVNLLDCFLSHSGLALRLFPGLIYRVYGRGMYSLCLSLDNIIWLFPQIDMT